MCIICLKPVKRAIPAPEMITACFMNNPDGAGIMYPENGEIRIIKGLMTIQSVFEALKAIPDPKSIPIVIHFRFATHGAKSAENTHPFPLSGDFNELRVLDHYVKSAIVHNGIMHQYGSNSASLSDSAFFAKLLSGLKTNKAIERAIEAHKNYGKFVVMVADGEKGAEIIRVGDFIKFKGCFWSNGGFRRTVYQNNVETLSFPTTGTIHNITYDDDDDINARFYAKYPAFQRGTQFAAQKIREFENQERNKRRINSHLYRLIDTKDLEKDEKFREYLEKGEQGVIDL